MSPHQSLIPVQLSTVKVFVSGSQINREGYSASGWAAVVTLPGNDKICISGCEDIGHPNRMILKATIEAINRLTAAVPHFDKVIIYSTLEYLIDGSNHWMKRWKKNSWQRDDQDIPNKDLWQAIDELKNKYHIQFELVRRNTNQSFEDLIAEAKTTAKKEGDALWGELELKATLLKTLEKHKIILRRVR